MVKFIVDSTFGLTREYAEEKGIAIISLTLLLGDKEFDEGYPDSWSEFYDELAKSKLGAKTSQPAPEKFKNAIEDFLAEDENSEILIMTIADRLSGTINSARIAAEQYPDKRVVAINSGEAGPSALMYIREMTEARDNGATLDELLALSDDLQQRIAMQFIPASLTELARSGRVNKLLSAVGNILKIKPVFEFAKNELSIYAKVLGFNRAVEAALNRLPQNFDKILVYYIGDDRNIAALLERMKGRFDTDGLEIVPMCPVGGVHIGAGTVGIVTLASKE